jgi:hypothetical protein
VFGHLETTVETGKNTLSEALSTVEKIKSEESKLTEAKVNMIA